MPLPTPLPDVLATVAANLRRARLAAGLSQDGLARQAGVSRRMLVAIEAGESNVSLSTLDRLARALGLRFGELVQPLATGGAVPRPARLWQGQQEESHGTLMEHIAHAGTQVELWLWQLAAGDSYEASPDPDGSHEMLLVLEGTLLLVLAGGERTLSAGETVTLASDLPYRYHNPGPERVRFSKNVIAPL